MTKIMKRRFTQYPIALLVLNLLFLSQVYAQSQYCDLANAQTFQISNGLLGSVENDAWAADEDKSSASSLTVTADLLTQGTVSQTLYFPTARVQGDSLTIMFGYSGDGLPNLATASSAITVVVYNGTDTVDVDTLGAQLVKVVNEGNKFTFGIRPSGDFTAVSVTLSPGQLMIADALAQIDVYYACVGDYTNPPAGQPGFCLPANSAVEVPADPTCVQCVVEDEFFAIDNNEASFASIQAPLALLGATSSLDIGYIVGQTGDSLEYILGIDADLLQAGTIAVTIQSMKGGTLNNDLISIDNQVGTVIGTNLRRYSIRPTQEYDAVRLSISTALASASLATADMKVYNACQKEYRPFVATSASCRTATPDSIGFGGAFCLTFPSPTCGVTNANQGPNNDNTDASELFVAGGLAANDNFAFQYNTFSPSGCSGDTVTITVSGTTGAALSSAALGQLQLELSLAGAAVTTLAGNSTSVIASVSNNKNILKMVSTGRYDGFKLTLNSNPSGTNRIFFYDVCARGSDLPTIDSTNSTLAVCYDTKATINVRVPAGAFAEMYADSVGGSPLPATGPTTFETAKLTSTTTFWLQTVMSLDGCTTSERTPVTITVRPLLATPTFTTTNPLTICKGSATTLTAISAPAGSTTVQWFDATGTMLQTQSNSFNTNVINVDSIVYKVRTITTDPLACTSGFVDFKLKTKAQEQGPLSMGCIENDGREIVTFQWADVPFSNGFQVSENGGASYYDEMTNDGIRKEVIELGTPYPNFATIRVRAKTSDVCGFSKESIFTCENKDCITYFSSPQYVYSSDVYLPDAQVQFLENTTGADSWQWTFRNDKGVVVATSNLQNPVINFTEAGVIKAELIVTVGSCVSQLNSIFIQIFPGPFITFPTAFSPNGDGNNDVFRHVGAGVYTTEYELRVYNQWGQEIFLTYDSNASWDGTFNGEPQPEGVYIYKVKARLVDQLAETNTGSFNLIR